MYDADGVRQERTHWRDQEISTRHRGWGFDCPAVDIDFLMLEYNRALPSALIEYKAAGARQPDLNQASYRALKELANHAGIPFLVVFYSPGMWWFRVMPANARATKHFAYNEVLTELEYVTRLYAIRGQQMPADLPDRLNDRKPAANEKTA